MSKLKVSIKKSTVTAMMKAGRKERINETELSQLARIKPCGIMHVTKTKKDSVTYTCPANINLTDRLKKAVSKYDFFFMMEQIVIMVQDVYNNGLNVNSVRFNMDDVYINEMTKEMYFIYFPIVGGQESADIVGFIENIIYTMTPVINEDTNYISRFMYYVRSFHGFNGNAIEKYISREERAVVNVLKNKAVTMQQTMQQQIMQQQTMQQQIMQQVMQGSMDGTTVLSDDGISVQQIQQMQPVNYHFASLTRQVTGEKIELGKPSFVLGKNPEKSDYAVADNTNISRVHAVITMRNGRYYVMDQNSTNGTFINGRIIKAGQETEILPGDCLMLANEEFIFNE
ncbi:FHA domain-containing protein [Agathobacter sp.]|uniref:FHA domain-containing protein n=1 Tax=Agathobacter sp. TaxID=2021311 RepID=UPI00280BE3CD|nr:FHA domain-containing protein [Agathobacter sp.]